MRKDLVVFRCKDCIEDLKEYNPYVYSDGKTIPLEKIEVIEVEKVFCENTEQNLNSKPQLQAAIKLDGYPEKPWKVVFWNSIYDRDQGLSEVYGHYESFAEAKEAIECESCSKYWAAYEIQLNNGEESETIYVYANCRPLADEFIKTTSDALKPKSHILPLKQYKVHVHFEGCIGYGVLAGDEDEAKEKALELYADEEPECLIDKLVYKVCDCDMPSGNSSCRSPRRTKFNRKLTGDEFNGLNKIASSTKMDCLFYILEDVGKDVIWDVKNNKILTIEEGVPQLMEGMVDPITEYGLTKDEIKAVEEIFKQIQMEEERWNNQSDIQEKEGVQVQ